MNIVLKCYGGSRLYGTNHINSDIDIRGIFQPNIQSLVLGWEFPSISANPPNKKMQNHDIDMVFYALGRYFDLLNKNAIQAVEMLFVPNSCIIYQSSIWRLITSYRQDIVNEIDLQQSGLYFSLILNELSSSQEILSTNSAKNLGHAIRIVDQCIELHRDGELQLPRPHANLYRQISTNSIPRDELISLAQTTLEQFNKIPSRGGCFAVKQELLLRCYGL